MTVLLIIGAVIIIGILCLIAKAINDYTIKHYTYRFFEWKNYYQISIFYIFIYSGVYLYIDALNTNGDLLNGILLTTIGAIGLIYVFIVHLMNTEPLIAIVTTLFQFLIYSVLVFVGIFCLLALIGYELRYYGYYNNRY